MGNKTDPRHSLPSDRLRALKNAALPLALILVVGALAVAAPMLRDDSEPASLSTDSSTPSSPSSSASPTNKDRNRPGASLAFKAEIVRGVDFKELPPIPKNFVRVDPASMQPIDFTVSSFNVLGHSHTAPGGNKPRFTASAARMGWQVSLLRSHDVSVAGLQEFQAPQFHTFTRMTGGSYGAFPGLGMGPGPVQNSIVWRTADWALVEAGTTPIPYFRKAMPMPHVLLRHVQTGREVWFANYHNPASTHGPAEGKRDAARAIQIGLFNRLRADGTPVVVTGDMNEKTDYLCPVASQANMHSADGGYADSSGCHPPGRSNIDWILGTDTVDFSGFVADRGPLVNRSTDHPMIRSVASLPPAYRVKDCMRHPVRKEELYCPRG